MTLKFFCVPLHPNEGPGPLLATASIPRDDAERFDALALDVVELFHPDTSAYARQFAWWEQSLRSFYRFFEEQINKYVSVMHRPALKPWSRLSFEQMASYGMSSVEHIAVVKLYEDDGSEWDPATAIPLYGPNPTPCALEGEMWSPHPAIRRTNRRIWPKSSEDRHKIDGEQNE